ncbi:hypothetical protein ACFPZ0_05950 [Streptomonospora nanhaiensis]|uniref:Uncharacterized protein n=1 Tax=Streptomonospora nanhaiensis TaxID=1323731 RepID=A0A853BVL9_9ACTN|nr:hypothetical protein [Streptomonospora nanhaiensis]MBV2364522.1 hypothetical protein [Streptomonospora nanhaiensis]MBX9388056.1 hypothetical protein [Streptomonospora nanhaiensis]NYI99133.1 hypothetical protein [Streptomonospora nanhaiensis]
MQPHPSQPGHRTAPAVRRRLWPAAALGLPLASPVAVRWILELLLGDGGTPGGDAHLPAASLPAWALHGIGLAASAVAAACLYTLVKAVRAGHVRAGWWAVVAPLTVLGAFGGALLWVGQAPVIGANIGYGMMLLAAGPLAAICLLTAVAGAVGLAVSARSRAARRA